MRKIGFIIGMVVATISLFSCKREKKEFIGPELGIASANFQIVDAFVINDQAINFTTDSTWFKATFNEHVSWNIKVRGLQSKAEKSLKGVSSELTISNSLWRGGHSGLNFFQAGETVVSELTVFGLDQVWYDTCTIVAVRNNFGPNTIIWWDMDQLGIAKHNIDCYWFEYYDAGEKIAPEFQTTTTLDPEPLQGVHRTLHGKELTVPVNYYIGGASHTYTVSHGFEASTEDVYLNFYVRKRTPTTSMGVTLISVMGTDTSGLSYETGTITWEGWKLVSVKLSEMQPNADYSNSFSPGHIRQFGTFLQTYTTTNVETGFDLDFVTITKNGPFNPDLY